MLQPKFKLFLNKIILETKTKKFKIMKLVRASVLLFTTIFLSCTFNLNAQDKPNFTPYPNQDRNNYEPPNLGLVQDLIMLKYGSEKIVIGLINTFGDSSIYKFSKHLQIYESIRLYTDIFILQLKADMESSNKMRQYRRIQKNKTDSRTVKYQNILFMAEDHLEKLQKKNSSSPSLDEGEFMSLESFPAEQSLEELTGLAGLVTGTIETVRKNRASRIENVTELIGSLRLRTFSELINQAKSLTGKDKEDSLVK